MTIALRELQDLRGIGPSLAADLLDLGYATPADLEGADPEQMYARLQDLTGSRQDRCVLYAFRCAVYQAEHADPDPALCDWWNHMDRRPR